MMPGILAERVVAGRLVSNVDVFGGREPQGSETRVAVSVPVCLTFAELLGLLTFQGSLTYAELDDESAILESLQYAVLQSDLFAIESYALRAMATYEGDGKREDFEYVTCLAAAITRVFGVSA
jgi:hypothetical protein